MVAFTDLKTNIVIEKHNLQENSVHSCDAQLRTVGYDEKLQYSISLLSLS